MKNRKRIAGGTLLVLAVTSCWYLSCHRYNNNPLHRAPELAAGFGEIRPDHFHMGADLRTNGREGMPVYAVADGYIHHISIQATGYGNAVFIKHNGDSLITVYAHLSAFEPFIEAFTSTQQYRQQSWQQELSPRAGAFPVKKGQRIGYSGNTGTSQGPHLHFEVRCTGTGKSSNPLLTLLPVKDTLPPVIERLYWYDRGNSFYETKGQRLNDGPAVVPSPAIGIGVQAFDQLAAGKFKTGVYQALLYKDGVLQYRFSLSELNQADSRYVNACIDYGRAIDSGQVVQLLFSLPGNRLPFARAFAARGAVDLSDRRLHQLKVVVTDIAGNKREKSFSIQYNGAKPLLPAHPHTQLLYPGRATTVENEAATIRFSGNSFYDVVPFSLGVAKASDKRAVSAAVQLHEAAVPVHDSFTAGIRTTLPLESALRNRTVMVLNSRKRKTVIKGDWENNYMKGRLNALGTVQLIADTQPPVIQPQAITEKHITIICADELGDIAFFKGEADGHWLAFARKGNVFTYTREAHYPHGAKLLTITIKDVAGNTTIKRVHLPQHNKLPILAATCHLFDY